MNYGFNMGAAGVITSMYRQDVAANNLANIETTGFKPDQAFTVPRQAARQEDGLYNLPSNALLERLGAGVLLSPTRTSFRQGSIQTTRNPLDVAIEGSGFLSVGVSDSSRGMQVRLTRDGKMTMNRNGQLVSVNGGQPILDDSGRPITLDPRKSIAIDPTGSISQDGEEVAKLGFVDVPDKRVLRKEGGNLFSAPPAALASRTPPPPESRLVQFATESSGADPIQAMMGVTNAANAVGTTTRLMQIHDELLGRAINTLGKVSQS